MRLAVDYGRLKTITFKDTYPLLRMEKYLNLLVEANWFTGFDANFGYWKLEIPEEDQSKTEFICRCVFYQFKRILYDFCNDPSIFRREMNISLNQYNWKSCPVYLDYGMVFRNSHEKHEKDVQYIQNFLQGVGVPLLLRSVRFPITTSITWGMQ